MTQSDRRVVVTGLGAVTNVGTDTGTMWDALLAGRSGAGPVRAFVQDDRWPVTICGGIDDWEPAEEVVDRREARRMDRFCLLGLSAAHEAAQSCGVDFTTGDPTRRGVVIGSGVGGILTIEEGYRRLTEGGPRKLSPFTVPRLMVNACAGNVSIRYDLQGVNSAPATACATGAHAIGHAFHMIQRGDADLIFAGGSEAPVSPLCLGSFASMKALSTRNDDPTRASRPFDRDRDGFLLAEGAAVLVLEELGLAQARGARIFAEVLSCGISGDAGHIAAPDETGRGAVRAMRMALAEAGLAPTDIGYINAHGTSTPLGDAAEVRAVKDLFGDGAAQLAMSSTKSMTGHTLGAAGGIESAIVALALYHGVLPPTINLDAPDDGFDLDFVPHHAREQQVAFALNNSFGFGGHNVSVAFGRFR